MNQPDPAEIEAIAAKRCVDCGLHPIVDETGLCIECIEANTATLLAALATERELRIKATADYIGVKYALNEARPKLAAAEDVVAAAERDAPWEELWPLIANYHKATGPQVGNEGAENG